MEFKRVIGKIEQDLVIKAEKALSSVFLELGLNPSNTSVGQKLGGDPLLFSLLYPIEHIATPNIPTAGTDGKRYYWNPKFILDLSPLGLRLVCAHEAWHAIYMHPQRRGGRIPKLWNICVDYIVNGLVMEDMKFRKMDPKAVFNEHLGNYLTVEEYANILKDPFAPQPALGGKAWVSPENASTPSTLPKADDDRPLTDQEIKEIEDSQKKIGFFFADPDLTEEFKRPEKLYDYFYNLLPKCPECGKVGVYQMPNSSPKNSNKNKGDKKSAKTKGNKQDKQDQGDQPDQNGHSCDDHQHGNSQGDDQKDSSDQSDDSQSDSGSQPGSCCSQNGCGTCGGNEGVDIFGFGDTLDDHMDSEESPEKLGQRLADAIETARRMAGHIPAGLEGEIGKLTAPIVKWKDVVRTQMTKSRDGHTKNDWTRFKSRPLFAGLLIPKRIDNLCNFMVLLDTSGSMSKDDMAFGVSQLQSLDERGECVLVYGDATVYWSDAVKIRKFNVEELSKLKPRGGGGTLYSSVFTDYEKHIGKIDFMVIISDMYLMDSDVAAMQNPGIPVYWINTSTCDFTPPFGKIYNLRN